MAGYDPTWGGIPSLSRVVGAGYGGQSPSLGGVLGVSGAAPGYPSLTNVLGSGLYADTNNAIANQYAQGRQSLWGVTLSPETQALVDQANNPNAAPATVPGTAAPPAMGVGEPSGIVDPVTSQLALGNARGLDWNQVNQWDQILTTEGQKWGVDPAIVKAVMALESQGNPSAKNPQSSSYGLLQIQPEYHRQAAASLGYTLGTPEGDIGYFSALIAGKAPGQTLTGDPLSNAVEIMAGGTAGGTPEYATAYRHDLETLIGVIHGAQQVPGTASLPIIMGPTQLPGSAVTGLSPETGLPVNLDPAVSQWADPIHAASEFHGVPASRLAAEIAVNSGGQQVDPSMDTTAQVSDVYGGPAVGMMRITPQASGEYCSVEWCGWGDGSAETSAYGVNHNIYTPDGNIMMGAAILRSNYDLAAQMYPTATEDQLWDMASSLFETGTVNWDDGGDGTFAATTKQAIDAIAGTSTTTLAPVTPQDTTGVTQHPLTGEIITNATGPVPADVPTSAATSDPTGQAIADLADDYVNVNYVWGGNPRQGQNPYQTGWDCSGFVSFIADSMGYSVRDRPDGIPEGSGAQGDWAASTGRMKPVDQAQPGDVIFFDTRDSGGSNGGATGRYTHVGIYLGDGMMINAMQECGPGLQQGVTCGTGVVNMNDPYWSSHAVGSASMIPTG